MHKQIAYMLAMFIWVGMMQTNALTKSFAQTNSPSNMVHVLNYGARGDGNTLDTNAINRAIDECHAQGGGQVYFAPGKYVSGTIHLKSNVSLYFDVGARLVGTTKLDQYQSFQPPSDVIEARWGRWHRAMILGDGIENVTITGGGIIDGNKVFDPKGEEKMRGPHTIILGDCRNVTIRNLTITDSANYAVMLEHSHDIEVDNVTFTGGWDGVHFRGWKGRPCKHITITNCKFFTGDDSIAGRYWDQVLISNCIINSSCNGIRLIGPAKHLIVHDCLFYGPGRYEHRSSKRTNMLAGLNLQPGGWDKTEGALDDVMISNITMHNVAAPFHIVLKKGNTAGRIDISRINATGVYRAASTVESWANTPFERVTFRDMNIEYEGGATLKQAKRIVKQPGVDPRPLPVWGFFIKNVKYFGLEDVRLCFAKEDRRPVMTADSVDTLSLENFTFSRPSKSVELVGMNDVESLRLDDSTFSEINPSIKEVNILPDEPNSAISTGETYSVCVMLENGNNEGLAKIRLEVGDFKTNKWIWLYRDEKREIIFDNLVAPSPGEYQLQIGQIKKDLTVKP